MEIHIYHLCFNMSSACLNELIIIAFSPSPSSVTISCCFLVLDKTNDAACWKCYTQKKLYKNLWKFFHIRSNVNIFVLLIPFDSFRFFVSRFSNSTCWIFYYYCCALLIVIVVVSAVCFFLFPLALHKQYAALFQEWVAHSE